MNDDVNSFDIDFKRNLGPKPRGTSVVWNLFHVEIDDNGVPLYTNRSYCTICSKSVTCSKGNTSNMFSHLRTHHPDEYKALKPKKPISGHDLKYVIESSGEHGRQFRSYLWNYFTPGEEAEDTQSRKVTCNICSRELVYGSMRQHLQLQHSELAVEGLSSKRPADRVADRLSEADSDYVVNTNVKTPKVKKPKTEKSVSVPENLINKPPGHAAIWKYFLLEGNVDNQPINTDTVYCSICFQSVRSSRGSTAVMKQHIQLYHPEELGGSDLETQDDTRPASPGSRAMEDNNSPFTNIVSESRVPAPPVVSIRLQDADVQRHFLSFCAETHLPLSAQLPSKLCDLINRLTNIRCQLEDTFSTEEWRETAVNTADRTTETVIRPAIQDSQNEISLTASIWRSACGDNMLTLSVHLLNSTWSKSSYVLETIRLLDMNNADLLTNTLISTLTYWKIELRNIRAATVSLNQQILTSFNYMGPCLAIPCLGEAWNYSLTSAFEDSRVSVIVEKANNIVQYFNVNKETREKLRNRLKDLSLPVKDLFVPNLSCWCSLLRMINSVLNGLPAVCALYHDLPTAEITESWRLVSSLLTPLLEFSKALAAEESLTISAILPLVHSITDDILVNSGDVISPEAVLNDVQINDLKVLGIDLRSKIRDSLASSFSKPEVRSHLLIATLLDPRFRTATIPGLDETHVVIKSMMPEIQVESIDQTPKRQSSGMFATMLQSITPNVRSDDSEYEFHQYLRAPGCAISEDPLAWWLKHASSYPRLATLARRYLSTPALAGDSYKLFDPQRLDRADDRPGLDTQEAYLYTFLAASSSCHNS